MKIKMLCKSGFYYINSKMLDKVLAWFIKCLIYSLCYSHKKVKLKYL